MKPEEANKKLKEKFNQIINSYQQGMFKGLSLFYANIVKTQMSGRPGLNRRSGNLSKGWFIEKEGEKLNSVYKLRNREWYGKLHQHDNGFNGFYTRKGKNKFSQFKLTKEGFFKRQCFLPKRLTVYETFNKIGSKLIINSITSSIKQIFNKQ